MPTTTAKTVTIVKNPKDVLIINKEHTGFKSATCFACGEYGYIKGDSLGYPYATTKQVPHNWLHHKEFCPMNPLLDKYGELEGE